MSAQLLAQASNGRRVEQGAHRKVGIQAGVDRGDQAHRRQRIPAQIEERVIDPDPLQPEHLGVDAGQDLLDGAGRGAINHRPVYSGAGRARVSSLPLTVNGSASNTTTAAGTM